MSIKNNQIKPDVLCELLVGLSNLLSSHDIHTNHRFLQHRTHQRTQTCNQAITCTSQ